MHAVQLVDLAAVLSFHGPSLLYQQNLVSEEAMQSYWVASRVRFNQWHKQLGEHRQFEKEKNCEAIVHWWKENPGIVDEILLSEPLVRVFAAIGSGLDHKSESEQISPVTHSVYVSHLEARNRVLQILVNDRTVSIDHSLRMNRLRQAIERWTDTLLGYLLLQTGDCALSLGFDASRIGAFAEDAAQIPVGRSRETTWWLMSAAMRDALIRLCSPTAAFAKENRAVADSVLISLRPDLFDSIGVVKSLWLHRLERGAEQTDRVLKQLSLSDITSAEMLASYETVRETGFGRW